MPTKSQILAQFNSQCHTSCNMLVILNQSNTSMFGQQKLYYYMTTPIQLLGILLLCALMSTAQTCNTNQYNANGVCYACSVTCLTCTSSSTTSCASCPTTRSLTSQTSCQCLDGYVQSSTVVAACTKLTCHKSCLTCNNTATACSSCNSSNFRVYVASSKTCPCIAKYYDSNNPQCSACHYTCGLCTSSTNTTCSYCDSTAFRTLTSNSCPCNNGYYDTNVYTCSTCSHQCATCITSNNNCLTCGSNRLTAPVCLCQQGYYDDGVSTSCIACHIFCQNCSDGSSCNLCNSANFRVSSSISPLCICMDRYFSTGAALCSSCDPRCITCLSLSVCLTCNSTANRIYQSSSKFCVCMTGFYETATNIQQCSACDSRCKTCQGTNTNCTTCESTMNRVLTSNLCPCNTGFYQNAYIKCAACDTSCLSCTNPTTCATCVSSTLMTINSSNLCSCVSTMFFNTTLNKCQTCNYQCATCLSTSPTLCITCPSNSQRTFANSACPCNIHYFDDGSSPTCANCDHSCYTCSSTLATNCVTCNKAAYRFLSNSKCLCMAYYYDNGVLQLCQPCTYYCLTCVDANTCSSCDSTLHRVLTTSAPIVCACMTYYFQNSNHTCTPCLYNCATCNSITNCITCDASKFRVYNITTQLCDCMPGYYDNFVSQTCLPCLPQCLTCINSTMCSSCSSVLHRTITSTFLCPCIPLFFDQSGSCVGCKYFCKTCNAPTTCTACNSSASRLLNSIGLCICSNGYFDDGSNQLCQPCSYACQTCSTSSTNCISCDPTLRSLSSGWCNCAQYYYDNNSTVACSPCHYSCDTCNYAQNCTTCSSSKSRQFDTIHQYCICQIGYYDDGSNQLCLPCNYRCQSCTNTSQCLTCSAASYRSIAIAMCPCLDGYYDDGVSAVCVACQYSCQTCVKGNECLSCEAVTNNRVFDSNYLCKCVDRYYDDGNNNQLCLSCIYYCLTCVSSSTTCTSCNSTAFRTLSSSTCSCLQHFYDNLAQQCLPCHYTCLTCSQPNACSTCSTTAHRQINSTTGLCSCMNTYYDDGTNQLCKDCEPTCLVCLNTLSCLTCNVTRNRMLNSTTDIYNISSPYCVCFYRYYSPGSTQDCKPCHYSCQICSAGMRTNCVICNTTALRVFHQSSTSCRCIDGYYDNNVSQLCQPCNPACILCTTGMPNSCTACNPLYFLLSATTTCYSTCPDYYHNQLINMTCQSCSTGCLKCLNNTYCSKCQALKYLYQNICYSVCPPGTYTDSAAGLCINCPTGCLNCSGNSACFSCFDKFYYNSTLGFCFSCNGVCLTCIGPGQNQCLSCASPLHFYNNTCSVLVCPVGTYVHPLNGCISCSHLFAGSLTCNSSKPFACKFNYKFISDSCIYCGNVTGYTVKSDGSCNQICGDGLVITLQCDDGNLMNGDGCSSNCLIEKGWSCDNTASLSLCTLINPLKISTQSLSKQGGANVIRGVFQLSLPIRVSSGDFTVSISGIASSLYSVSIEQKSYNLSQIELTVNYQTDLQDKSLSISYAKSRRLLQSQNDQQLQNHQQPQNYQQLQDYQQYYGKQSSIIQSTPRLLAISFANSFSLTTYPPAYYYSDSTISHFSSLKYYFTALSVSLIVLCFVLIPNKMHLHSLTLIYIPSQIYITLGVGADGYTDWIKYTLENLKPFGFIGGFTLGQCCSMQSSFFGISTQIMQMSGIVLVIILLSWLLLVGLSLFHHYCLKISNKLTLLAYFILTIHIALFFTLNYSTINALVHYSLFTANDTFNTTLSILLSILMIIFVTLSWIFTYNSNTHQCHEKIQLQKQVIFDLPEYRPQSKDIPDSEIISQMDITPSKRAMVDSQQDAGSQYKINASVSTQQSRQQQFHKNHLLFDYLTLYNHTMMKTVNGQKIVLASKSKYFLPILLTKIYLTSLFSSILSKNPVQFFILQIILQAIFLLFILTVKPFLSTFTNLRLVLLSSLLIATDVTITLYLFYSLNSVYILFYEQITVYFILALLSAAVLFAVMEHLMSWKTEVWKLVEPYLKGARLMGTRKANNVQFDDTSNNMNRRSFKTSRTSFNQTRKTKQNETEEIDAFYARMLKKDELNRKYRRERLIR